MWFFNYFAGSFILTSAASFIYDTFSGKYRHKYRSPDELLQCAKQMMPLVLVNIFCVTLPYSLFVEHAIEDVERNQYGFVPNFCVIYLIADFLTYWFHRLFHHPKLYFLHKTHHDYVYPIAMEALYTHPIDYFVVNLGPFTSPIFILYPRDYIIKITIIIAVTLTTIQSHGGYTFLNDAHLKHHKFYKVNYGLGVSDRIFGTFK